MASRLNGLVRDFAYWLKSEDGQKLVKDWGERKDKYRELLENEAKIEDLKSEEQVINLFANLWAAGPRFARKIIRDNGLERVKEWLKDLITRGEKGLSDKDFDDLVKGLKGVGHAMLSELLCLRFPERYWIWNNPLDDAVKKLKQYGALEWKRPSKGTEGEKYFAYQKVLDRILSAMREVPEISETLGRELNYSDADMFVFWIAHYWEQKLSKYFKARGFHFTYEQIAIFYAALKTKGFVILSGLSGTGKTKLAQLFAELLCPCQKCHGGETRKDVECECTHLFLSVRPDWRDSKALLGYYNPLTEQYESTPLLKFLLRARDDYEKNGDNAKPYFVILDEMNLSHVEYYFADFLSVLESGRDERGWTKEPLRLHSFKQSIQDQDGQKIPPELHLPPNLYIIGTVNIDETTYMFSPKVLDRAFTIEFRDVDFSDYPKSESGDAQQIADQIRDAILNDLCNGGKFCAVAADKGEIKRAIEEGLGDAKQQLEELNRRLQPYDLHFGYRVLDEIALFVRYAKSLPEEVGKALNGDEALDYAVLMKVLPKFHGPRQKLERPLREILKWSAANDTPEWVKDLTKQPTLQDIVSLLGKLAQPQKRQEGAEKQEGTNRQEDAQQQESKFRYPATAKKALQMLRQLYETGFASFAQ